MYETQGMTITLFLNGLFTIAQSKNRKENYLNKDRIDEIKKMWSLCNNDSKNIIVDNLAEMEIHGDEIYQREITNLEVVTVFKGFFFNKEVKALYERAYERAKKYNDKNSFINNNLISGYIHANDLIDLVELLSCNASVYDAIKTNDVLVYQDVYDENRKYYNAVERFFNILHKMNDKQINRMFKMAAKKGNFYLVKLKRMIMHEKELKAEARSFKGIYSPIDMALDTNIITKSSD